MELGFSHLLGVTYLIVVKAGYTAVLGICSSYLKHCVENTLKIKNRRDARLEERNEKDLLEVSSNISNSSNSTFSKNKGVKKLSLSKRIFQMNLSLVFIPMLLSSAFYTGSLYIGYFVGNMADMMKQMPFLMFTMIFTLEFLFTAIPVLL